MPSRCLALGRLTAILVLLLSFAAPAAARSKRVAPPEPSLRGSWQSIRYENQTANDHRLERIYDWKRLQALIEDGELVQIEDTASYFIDEEVGEEDPDRAELYIYARPWVKQFLDDLGGEARREHGIRLAVTSLVRPRKYQRYLRSNNRAASRESTHATGATVDIAMANLNWKQKQFIRKYLLRLERQGLIQATEEDWPGCWHIFVSPDYGKAEPQPEEK